MGKYYWLRLQKDFFHRHDIRIIESMPNGKDYILFYLKLLVESVSHEGELRFSESIPYNENMLATVTETNVDIVRSALKVFTELNMIEILDDQTIFMTEVDKMIGSAEQDEHTRESTRKRVQAYRERQKLIESESQSRYGNVTCNGEIEKEIEIESEIEKETKKRKAPAEYFQDDPDLESEFRSFIDMRKKIKAPMSDRAIDLALSKLEELSGGSRDMKIKILDQSIMNSWKGLFPIDKKAKAGSSRSVVDDWMNA